MSSPSERDFALGAVLGALAGDAAGARLEFLGRLPADAEVAEAMTLPGGGYWRVAPGQVTDDGELTIALLIALAAEQAFDLDRIATQYRRWYDSRPFDVGGTIGALFGGATDASGMQQLAQQSINSKANGSLMRASPLGVWGRDLEPDELAACARDDSSLSHANPSCRDAVACYAIAIAALARTRGDHGQALDTTQRWARDNACEEVREWLALAQRGETPAGSPQIGFAKIAFVHAFHHLQARTAYAEALRAVLAIGGDTDTNACIVGGMIGAAVGAEAIPQPMQRGVLECDTARGRRRPSWLHPRAVPELVESLTAQGPPRRP